MGPPGSLSASDIDRILLFCFIGITQFRVHSPVGDILPLHLFWEEDYSPFLSILPLMQQVTT